MINIYYTSLAEGYGNAPLDKYFHLLPDAERSKLLAFHRAEDAYLSLFGKLLLLFGLRQLNPGIRHLKMLSRTSCNKPVLAGLPGISFNISHTKEMVAVAICDSGRVGIDAEVLAGIDPADLGHMSYLLPMWCGETSPADARAFFTFWTKCESALKGDGRGFLIDIANVMVFDDYALVEGCSWYFTEVGLAEDVICHVASVEKNAGVRVQNVTVEGLQWIC